MQVRNIQNHVEIQTQRRIKDSKESIHGICTQGAYHSESLIEDNLMVRCCNRGDPYIYIAERKVKREEENLI